MVGRLLVAVLVAGALVWCSERLWLSTDEDAIQSTQLIQTLTDEVTHLVIDHGSNSVSLVQKSKDEWDVNSPVETPADAGYVSRLLGVLEALKREEVITAEQRISRDLSLQDFGLTQPRIKLTLGDRFTSSVMLIGNDAPLGEQVYVKFEGQNDVFATSRDLVKVLPEGVGAVRDYTLIRGDAASTTRLEIQRPGSGFIQLVQAGGKWTIKQPLVCHADSARVAYMLETLYHTTAVKFVWDPPAAGAEKAPADTVLAVAGTGPQKGESYDLSQDTAQVRVTVWIGDQEAGREILLGRAIDETGDLIYAKRRDLGSLCTVQRRVADAFLVSVDAIRERGLFVQAPDRVRYCRLQNGGATVTLIRQDDVGWKMTEPVQWKADDMLLDELVRGMLRVRAVVFAGVLQTNAPAREALARPEFGIALSESIPEEVLIMSSARSNTVPALVVAKNPGSGSTLWARFEDDDSLYEVEPAMFAFLPPALVDPLLYRDRTMLALPPETVRRIGVASKGVEQGVARNDAGDWLAWDETRKADRMAVEDILLAVANLRAVRVEALDPGDLEPYGLNTPYATVTIGLSGEGAIQKSLLLGFRSRTDGLHAMIKGEDLVFVLENGIVDRLTRDLYLPAEDQAP